MRYQMKCEKLISGCLSDEIHILMCKEEYLVIKMKVLSQVKN